MLNFKQSDKLNEQIATGSLPVCAQLTGHPPTNFLQVRSVVIIYGWHIQCYDTLQTGMTKNFSVVKLRIALGFFFGKNKDNENLSKSKTLGFKTFKILNYLNLKHFIGLKI